MVCPKVNRAFLMTTQNVQGGGFAKWRGLRCARTACRGTHARCRPDHMPDPLHAYMGLAGLALQNEPGLAPLHSALNIPAVSDGGRCPHRRRLTPAPRPLRQPSRFGAPLSTHGCGTARPARWSW